MEIDQRVKLELGAYKFSKSWDEQVKITRAYYNTYMKIKKLVDRKIREVVFNESDPIMVKPYRSMEMFYRNCNTIFNTSMRKTQ